MDRYKAEIELKRIFGIDHFYDEQWDAIKRILKGERILMIQRTGFGKSLCYQFPATQFDGVTIVFSPLIALMRDQVRSLNSKGIAAAYINSEQTYEENIEVMDKALRGELKIIYVAPERQNDIDWINTVKNPNLNISMVVVDEAHAISTWGHDFRPAFRRIVQLTNLLPEATPILAVTATATKKVEADIKEQLGKNMKSIRGPLKRNNFKMHVIEVKSYDEKMLWLAANLNSLPGMGMIYVGTRLEAEHLVKWLKYKGINAIDYHAGYESDVRKSIEERFINNQWKCIVSTNALGMGMDKADVRFVIHTQIPVSPIHYYQEIGRGGRDGNPTTIILFFNSKIEGPDFIMEDIRLPKSFIEGARSNSSKYEKVIELLRKEPMKEKELLLLTNLKLTEWRIIKNDLIDQKIIAEVNEGRTKYFEYRYDAPRFDYSYYEQLRANKLADLSKMVEYVYTKSPRMKYLCGFLDSNEECNFENCDNTTLAKLTVLPNSILEKELEEFRKSDHPDLIMAEKIFKRWKSEDGQIHSLSIVVSSPGLMEIYRDKQYIGKYNLDDDLNEFSEKEREVLKEHIEKYQKKRSHITNGVAGSYYGVTKVGRSIHKSKYEGGGDFEDFLLDLTLSAFERKFKNIHFDVVLYVPPTKSGDLVRHFAEKFANAIGIPISHSLVKQHVTEEQKVFQNKYKKLENVKGAFMVDNPEDVRNKIILLIDDIYDSGATLKEISQVLTESGAKYIVPLVIAKTVGGTL